MSEAKFTPGPWFPDDKSNFGNLVAANSGRKSHEYDSGTRTVAMVQSCGFFETHDAEQENINANISLIAAAPDMYAALERCLRREYNPFEPDNQSAFYMRIDAILKKARGEA
ncbi:MAG: hypothetical protein HGA87_01285 [Desulfobulbaceae bacterium]|nr:hypothetical protein [Desulfobulbaceae bacterium]